MFLVRYTTNELHHNSNREGIHKLMGGIPRVECFEYALGLSHSSMQNLTDCKVLKNTDGDII